MGKKKGDVSKPNPAIEHYKANHVAEFKLRDRRSKWDESEIIAKLEGYIDNNEYVTVKDFCVKHKISSKMFNEIAGKCKELKDLVQFIHDKREVWLENNALNGNIRDTFAIFALKQPTLGWTDKQQIEQTVDSSVNIIFDTAPMRKLESGEE